MERATMDRTMASTAAVVPAAQKKTARQIVFDLVDRLIFNGGDESKAYQRASEAIVEDGLLDELWAELGPSLVSYVYRMKNGGAKRIEMHTLLSNGGHRIVSTETIRTESNLYMVAYKVDGDWKRFRELGKPDCKWIAEDYERRCSEMSVLSGAFRRIEKELVTGKTIGVQFPTEEALRKVLTKRMQHALGVKK